MPKLPRVIGITLEIEATPFLQTLRDAEKTIKEFIQTMEYLKVTVQDIDKINKSVADLQKEQEKIKKQVETTVDKTKEEQKEKEAGVKTSKKDVQLKGLQNKQMNALRAKYTDITRRGFMTWMTTMMIQRSMEGVLSQSIEWSASFQDITDLLIDAFLPVLEKVEVILEAIHPTIEGIGRVMEMLPDPVLFMLAGMLLFLPLVIKTWGWLSAILGTKRRLGVSTQREVEATAELNAMKAQTNKLEQDLLWAEIQKANVLKSTSMTEKERVRTAKQLTRFQEQTRKKLEEAYSLERAMAGKKDKMRGRRAALFPAHPILGGLAPEKKESMALSGVARKTQLARTMTEDLAGRGLRLLAEFDQRIFSSGQQRAYYIKKLSREMKALGVPYLGGAIPKGPGVGGFGGGLVSPESRRKGLSRILVPETKQMLTDQLLGRPMDPNIWGDTTKGKRKGDMKKTRKSTKKMQKDFSKMGKTQGKMTKGWKSWGKGFGMMALFFFALGPLFAALEPLTDIIGDTLEEWLDSFAPQIEWLANWIAANAPLITGFLQGFMQGLYGIINAVPPEAWAGLAEALAVIGNVIIGFGQSVIGFLGLFSAGLGDVDTKGTGATSSLSSMAITAGNFSKVMLPLADVVVLFAEGVANIQKQIFEWLTTTETGFAVLSFLHWLLTGIGQLFQGWIILFSWLIQGIALFVNWLGQFGIVALWLDAMIRPWVVLFQLIQMGIFAMAMSFHKLMYFVGQAGAAWHAFWGGVVGATIGFIQGAAAVIAGFVNTILGGINAIIIAGNVLAAALGLPQTPLLGLYTVPNIEALQTGGLIRSEGLFYLHAGEAVVPAGDNFAPNITNHFTINATIREDADVYKLAERLSEIQDQEMSRRGVGYNY